MGRSSCFVIAWPKWARGTSAKGVPPQKSSHSMMPAQYRPRGSTQRAPQVRPGKAREASADMEGAGADGSVILLLPTQSLQAAPMVVLRAREAYMPAYS